MERIESNFFLIRPTFIQYQGFFDRLNVQTFKYNVRQVLPYCWHIGYKRRDSIFQFIVRHEIVIFYAPKNYIKNL